MPLHPKNGKCPVPECGVSLTSNDMDAHMRLCHPEYVYTTDVHSTPQRTYRHAMTCKVPGCTLPEGKVFCELESLLYHQWKSHGIGKEIHRTARGKARAMQIQREKQGVILLEDDPKGELDVLDSPDYEMSPAEKAYWLGVADLLDKKNRDIAWYAREVSRLMEEVAHLSQDNKTLIEELVQERKKLEDMARKYADFRPPKRLEAIIKEAQETLLPEG